MRTETSDHSGGSSLRAVPVPFLRGPRLKVDVHALAASLPPPTPLSGPQLRAPAGWVRLAFAEADQTLVHEDAPVSMDALTRISLTALRPGAQTRRKNPHTLHLPAGALPLAIEPFATQAREGIHAAWLQTAPGSTVVQHRWMLLERPGSWIDIRAEFSGHRAPVFTRVTEALVADVGPWPSVSDTELHAGHAEVVSLLEQWRSTMSLAAPDGENSDLAPLMTNPSGRSANGELRWSLTRWSDRSAEYGRAASWEIDPSEATVHRTPDRRQSPGFLPLAAMPYLVLCEAGYRPQSPFVGVRGIPVAIFHRRLRDASTPLPGSAALDAPLSSPVHGQSLLERWWSAPWTGWAVMEEASSVKSAPPDTGPAPGASAVVGMISVHGFGDYRWLADDREADAAIGTQIRCVPTDGVELHQRTVRHLTALVA